MLAKSAQKTVLKQGTSAEKEFLCTKCYSNLRKENGMSFTQEETLRSGALEVRPHSIKCRVLEPKEKQVSFWWGGEGGTILEKG